ncbi:MAG: NAD-dependent epimerase/dehydratase family protein [Myxococcales bacterium]|nr:NAD-dependent epimerase/dehydratase family protein [Myxococcales bacterium]USN51854.1 MAG: NAD-dependent epimerase/dehydratase family protein [Myxococcales bacterium]
MQEKIISSKTQRVLITGNAGALGRNLVKELLKDQRLSLFGVDRRPLEPIPEGLSHYPLDLRRKSALEVLRKIKPQSIIHLGIIRSPQIHRKKRANAYYFNLESTSQLLTLAEQLNVKKFIFLSTANLYGPSPNTQGLLNEDTQLHGANKSPEFRDLVSLDMMVQSFFWKQPKTQTIILRPCHIVGPHLRNAPSRYLKLDTIPTILGFDPMLQLLHESDLIKAIILSLNSKARGVFNIAGPDVAPLSRIIKALRRPTIALPEKMLKLLTAGTFFSRQSSFPVGEIEHLKFSSIIDDRRAREDLGFKPLVSLKAILQEINEAYEKQHSDS